MKDHRTDSEIRREALTYAQQLIVAYVDPQYDAAEAVEAIPKGARPEVLFMLTKLLGDFLMGAAGPTADPEQVVAAIGVVFDKHRAES